MYLKCIKPRTNDVYDHISPEYEIPSCSLVSVLRDCQWRRLPYNLVVKGDLLKLRYGDVAPCDLQPVLVTKNKNCHGLLANGPVLLDGAVFANDDISCPALSYSEFVALSTPCRAQVRKFLQDSLNKPRLSPKQTPVIETAEEIYCRYVRIWGYSLFILCLINVIVRSSIGKTGNPGEVVTFFLGPVIVLICINPMTIRWLLTLTDLWGNARLQSHFLFHHERRYNPDHELKIRTSSRGWLPSILWRRESVSTSAENKADQSVSSKSSLHPQPPSVPEALSGSSAVTSLSSSTPGSLLSETGLSVCVSFVAHTFGRDLLQLIHESQFPEFLSASNSKNFAVYSTKDSMGSVIYFTL